MRMYFSSFELRNPKKRIRYVGKIFFLIRGLIMINPFYSNLAYNCIRVQIYYTWKLPSCNTNTP